MVHRGNPVALPRKKIKLRIVHKPTYNGIHFSLVNVNPLNTFRRYIENFK